MAKQSSTQLLGFFGLLLGGMLAAGGLLFLLAAAFIRGFPQPFYFPAGLQVMLGFLGMLAGYSLMQGYSTARTWLLLVALGVLADMLFYAGLVVHHFLS